MGLAIGKKGASIKKASEVMGKKIEVVEYNSNPEQFLKNCFLPAQVTSIVFTGERVHRQPRLKSVTRTGASLSVKMARISSRQRNWPCVSTTSWMCRSCRSRRIAKNPLPCSNTLFSW